MILIDKKVKKSGFTLIELLVVIAILAVLAVVVVLTLNPAGLLQESRDANRLQDMATLNSAINYSLADNPAESLGNASSVYISVPDPVATSTAGDQCQGLGLSSLPAGDSYQCESPSYYRGASGTGWIPINFSAATFGSPLSELEIDPINTTSTSFYYTYTTGGGKWQLTAHMESTKYIASEISSGGSDPALYTKGSNLSLSPFVGGMVGWWQLNEGSGTTAYDSSGFGNNGTWSGTASGTGGTYYKSGINQNYSGYFDGGTDKIVGGGLSNLSTNYTIIAWIIKSSSTGQEPFFSNRSGLGEIYFGMLNSGIFLYENDATSSGTSAGSPSFGQWQQIAAVATPSSLTLYLNGVSVYSGSWINGGGGSGSLFIGYDTSTLNYWGGSIEDLRIYDRSLSAAEITAMYNAGK